MASVFLFLQPPHRPDSYAEAHPYGPVETPTPGGPTFHPDLAVRVAAIDAPVSGVLAVMDGLLWAFASSSNDRTVDLMLDPSPDAANALARTSMFRDGRVVFVYRGVSTEQVLRLLEPHAPRVPRPEDVEMTDTELLDAFIVGQLPIFIGGGFPIATPVTDGNDADVGFEILFLPPMKMTEGGQERVRAILADPNDQTRRFDPAVFYANVRSEPTLDFGAPGHVTHPLLTMFTNRVLLEVRDEYDEPYIGVITVTVGGGGATHALTAANRSHLVLTEDPTSRTWQIELTNNVLSDLPSGNDAASSPARVMGAPAHWPVQRVFMADVDDADNWFVANTDPLPRFTSENQFEHLIDGIDTFEDYVGRISTTASPDDWVLHAGWWLDDTFDLHGADSTYNDLMGRVTGLGGTVRVMLYKNITQRKPKQKKKVKPRTDGLPGPGTGHLILDSEGPFAFAHHQKLLVINSAFSAGYCGGVDVNPDRLDTIDHLAKEPFHDTHARVIGPAINDMVTTFQQRWNAHPSNPPLLPTSPLRLPSVEDAPNRTNYIQFTRTYAQKHGYPFLGPGGGLGTLNALIGAIKRARNFMYIEDQYLNPYAGTSPSAFDDSIGITKALQDMLKRETFKYLVIVIPNHTTVPQQRFRRRAFLRALRNDPTVSHKTKVFYLKRREATGQGEPAELHHTALLMEAEGHRMKRLGKSGGKKFPNEIYCHSKLFFIDDVYIKIGSANLNRRGMTHDTEADLHVIDGALSHGARRSARDFRLALWAEHMGLDGADAEARLSDWRLAEALWDDPPDGAQIAKYREEDEIELIHTQTSWNKFIDPEGRL